MESIAPKHVQSLTNLISEDINEYFGKAMYLDHNVIIMKSNGYINISKFCSQYNKLLGDWRRQKQAKDLSGCLCSFMGIPVDDLFVEIKGGVITEIRGTYIHPKLAPHIASWINPKVAIIVADIVNNYQIREYQKTISIKDDKIDSLERLIKQMQLDNNRALSGIQKQNEELKDTVEELKTTTEEVKEQLNDMNDKLDLATDEYVPPSQNDRKEEWFVLMMKSPTEFYVLRRQKETLDKFVRQKINQGYTEIRRFKNPNAVNVLNRLKDLKNQNIKVRINTILIADDINQSRLINIIKNIEQQKKDLMN